jgi:D-cysteine desulfhydrase family pyridoxal phosphate-dependent enzyme
LSTNTELINQAITFENRVHLFTSPTPIEKPKGLQTLLPSVDLLLKRDDVMQLALGGNKVRKLEFLLADAQTKGCNVVITTGDLHSNHARLTAGAARKLGMKPVLLIVGRKPDKIEGNLALDYLFGADVRYFDGERKDVPGEMEKIQQEYEARKARCYVIPRGGASAHGVLGYVNAVFELKKQLGAGAEEIDYVVFPTGTGATQAGLVLGTKLAGLKAKVIGISVGRPSFEIASDVKRLVIETGGLLQESVEISPTDLIVNDDYTCGGYAIITREVNDVMETVAEKEGLLVDPVYSGKGMLGLLSLAENGYFSKGSRVLFIHTGGSPIIFSHYRPNIN